MNYTELISLLSAANAASPAYEAGELARVLCGVTKEWCLLNRSAALPETERLLEALGKRERGIPLQYILGEAWFYGYRFFVNEDCLIPQPDTEHTVALAIKNLPPNGRLLDLCTGSGCIPIAVLLETPDAHATAIEISKGAIKVAARNSALHSVADRLQIIESDVLLDDISTFISNADVITSNPPYINTDIIPSLSAEVRHEPIIALDGGADGMIFYRHFIGTLAKLMKPCAVMILEIGYDQANRITDLCAQNGLRCLLHKDFGGNLRVAEIRK